jgi:hypothetical protein
MKAGCGVAAPLHVDFLALIGDDGLKIRRRTVVE